MFGKFLLNLIYYRINHYMPEETILITGASGQIGEELTLSLRNAYGTDRVIATDIRELHQESLRNGPFELLDVCDPQGMKALFERYKPSQVYHLAALLSANSERNPQAAWKVNMDGLFNVLAACTTHRVGRLFWPSSIAVFGPGTPRLDTPQYTVMDPVSIYGISKLAGERWCEYYYLKEGLDVRSIRYPGLVSYKTEPGGGTTDYAVEIFFKAIQDQHYQCFLAADTRLPMMYMPDAIRGTLELMGVSADRLRVRSAYNMAAFSFGPREIYKAIKKHISGFTIAYQPDFRDKLAQGWPQSIDDTYARDDWGWKNQYDLEMMTEDMLEQIQASLSLG
jgi:nucleoside-diphosphate-sugar epimerase